MKKFIFFALIVVVALVGIAVISEVVKATSGNNKLTKFNSIVLSPETEQATIESLDKLFRDEFGENGYEYYEATAEYGTSQPVKEFRYPDRGLLENKKINQKIEELISASNSNI